MIETWGTARDGSPIHRIAIARDGLRAKLITFGAALQDLKLERCAHSLVLGYDNAAAYLVNPSYFGATVGRYANRIANGMALIAGRRAELDRNYRGKHHLHGGAAGSAFRNWTLKDYGEDFAVFSDTLPDDHMGFPGNLSVSVRYHIQDGGNLDYEVRATTDAPTLCNFTGHSYFNLDGSSTIRHHRLRVNAGEVLPVDDDGIPQGAPACVAGTDLDFRASRPLVTRDGICVLDHNYCLPDAKGDLRPMAELTSAMSGICLQLWSNQPGLQVYTGAGIATGIPAGADHRRYGAFSGIALEPQVWPDAPNQIGYPSAALLPGEQYRHRSRYAFTRSTAQDQRPER